MVPHPTTMKLKLEKMQGIQCWWWDPVLTAFLYRLPSSAVLKLADLRCTNPARH